MPVDTIAIWMYFAITAVICGKVITGTVLNKQRKELATIHEKLRAVRLELEHASERKKATENVTSFQERRRAAESPQLWHHRCRRPASGRPGRRQSAD